MQVRQLIEAWQESASEPRTAESYTVRLSIHDAAKLAALREMFPGRSEQDLITDLLSAALDEIEAAFPYIQGSLVVSEDDRGDPIFEDAGRTPQFHTLTRKHLERIRREQGDAGR